ncbi:ribonuclease H-like domain-containing protein [Endogone sp. FLAS-F59071]|nr:ribonuclease H-like domain-containing protein [Endogone sp. FLAS-F59071]|eukprot:RUS13798.1 ribonuclease H-like domain-containing protein [Endogone sp. FLAS-F59071]
MYTYCRVGHVINAKFQTLAPNKPSTRHTSPSNAVFTVSFSPPHSQSNRPPPCVVFFHYDGREDAPRPTVNGNNLSVSLQIIYVFTLKRLTIPILKEKSKYFGLGSPSTKSAIIEGLCEYLSPIAASPTRQNTVPATIISLDMGYRNLAFVRMTRDFDILDWARIEIGLGYHRSDYAVAVSTLLDRFPELRCASFPAGNARESSVDDICAVLVERQRFRTGGSPNIPDGVIKTNAVEAMTWGILVDRVRRNQACITDSSLTTPKIIIESVLPQRVFEYFQSSEFDDVGESDSTPQASGKYSPNSVKSILVTLPAYASSSYYKKRAAEKIVKHWLETDSIVRCSPELKNMFREEKKKDDLSDCLLQAVAWVVWRKRAIEEVRAMGWSDIRN